jgi:phage terminase large subunit-like protein
MVEFRQGFRSMAAPTRELEKLIVSKKLAHGGNPVTRWMAANVAVAQDPAGNLKPAKDKSAERIDGIVALIMGVGRARWPGSRSRLRRWPSGSEQHVGYATADRDRRL